ncbi:MAG: hypothetical protein HZB14_00975 [Actinobacteria bacterium]|nr:hypothetical protein [Actinomycetota bacterium]
MSSLVLALAAGLMLLAGAGLAVAADNANQRATKKGASYLYSRSMSAFSHTGFQADAVSALTAARRSGNVKSKSKANAQIAELTGNLKEEAPNYGNTAGAAGKLLLAAVAAGERPRCFGSAGNQVDLVAMLNQFYSSKGQYGDTAFDHALAILGLKAAHEKVPSKAVKFAKDKRKSRGWNFAMSTTKGDDVESTALMIQALRAAGVKRTDRALTGSFKWMRFQRNVQDGYHPDTAGGDTNSNATALVIQAYDALGKPASKSKLALRKLQAKDGHFKVYATSTGVDESKVLATSDSVLALADGHYPVVKRKKADNSCV